jgi:hypothetical protein
LPPPGQLFHDAHWKAPAAHGAGHDPRRTNKEATSSTHAPHSVSRRCSVRWIASLCTHRTSTPLKHSVSVAGLDSVECSAFSANFCFLRIFIFIFLFRSQVACLSEPSAIRLIGGKCNFPKSRLSMFQLFYWHGMRRFITLRDTRVVGSVESRPLKDPAVNVGPRCQFHFSPAPTKAFKDA